MRKSLVRWGVTLGLIGSTLLGSVLTGNKQALALSEEQVLQKLLWVPVFTITNADGAPLVRAVNSSEQSASVAGVFISQQDAEAFVERLKAENPDLGNAVKVTPVSLAKIYQIATEASEDREEPIVFDLIPVQQQVDRALTLLRQGGQQVEQFPGVPLFFARGKEDREVLTFQRGDQQAIPFFFNQEDLQSVLERFKQQYPDESADMQIEVAPLNQVIQAWRNEDNPELNRVMLIPPRESLPYVRSLQQGSGQNPPATP